MVSLERLEYSYDIVELQFLINKHLLHTNSYIASEVLTNWEKYLPKFVKIIPYEFKKLLEEEKLRKIKEKLKFAEEDIFHN